jgi:nitrate reductase beta subunit
VGRIRYLGNVLYDASRIEEVASSAKEDLIMAQRSLILDPNDPEVIKAAKANGVPDGVITSAQESPVYRFVKDWGLAVPLHAEFRTLPMLFYVPPLSPVISGSKGDITSNETEDLFHDIAESRVPIQYMAEILGTGATAPIEYALRKQYAVRMYRRQLTVGDVDEATADRALFEADCSREEAEAIYRLTSLAKYEDRFVIPPAQREQAIEMIKDPLEHKQHVGFGFTSPPMRV